jgi:beta-galactosidase
MKTAGLFLSLMLITFSGLCGQTTVNELDNWKFHKGDLAEASNINFDDSGWESVTVPHDWAIYGPFDKEIDKQTVKIVQNNQTEAAELTGRTGALPFIGVGWYRTKVKLPDFNPDKRIILSFDGAMSHAEVYVNGQKVGGRPYGYSYFYFDITANVSRDKDNLIAVRLENLPFASRWYPGAGLYRKVRLIVRNQVCFKQWGHYITTPYVAGDLAKVDIRSQVEGESLTVKTTIREQGGLIVAKNTATERFGDEIEQSLAVKNPRLWSPETPELYTAEIQLYQGDVLKDSEIIRFGIRKIRYSPENGFELNGEKIKFKGVCLHHDQGPLGTAVNRTALKRQLTILKDMGCNAIRTSHNMPSLEQLELCDEMGFMVMAESFDEWKAPKVENGYHLYFDEWAEKDVVNLVHATRNHPCIVLWSAGNEVPDQLVAEGVKRAKWLQEIFHREDPTRPVTAGMDMVKEVMASGFGALLDVPGLNYRVNLYEEANQRFPQGFILGSETASTISSRGVYKFPVVTAADKTYSDHQCSSYDLECCNWSNIPEVDFVMQDDKPWVIGEFVWTGFDYLGEPTPYDQYWPSRSSYFGICDLAGIPKDRYYLYRSRWNTTDATLHILPHWNWEGREGQTTPVFVYTSYKSAELFVNGKSQGIQKKNSESKLTRYRLMWMDVKYEPGTIKVIAYDDAGRIAAKDSVVTAGKPHHLRLEADRKIISPKGEDLSYVTVTIVDKHGFPCPLASNRLNFEVKGSGSFRAVCNGDATSLEEFHKPTMKAFNGKLVVTVQSAEKPGNIELTVTGDGLKKEKLTILSQ